MPQDVIQWVRCWDLAATEKTENGDPAYTAGVLMGKRKNGRYVIADVINKQMNASDVRKTIKLTAQADRAAYKRVRIRLPKDPGQAGKEQAESYIKFLSGFDVTAVAESGSKEARAEPMENERDRPHGYTTSRNRCLRWSGAANTTSASRCWHRSRRRTPATASERLPVIRYIP